MRHVFVDSSGFFAVLVREDADHERAEDVFARAAREHRALLTTNAVVYEAYALFLARSRRGRTDALAFLDLVAFDPYRVERVRRPDEERAIALVRAHQDKAYSLCDATSFVVMERLGIREAISFHGRAVASRRSPKRNRRGTRSRMIYFASGYVDVLWVERRGLPAAWFRLSESPSVPTVTRYGGDARDVGQRASRNAPDATRQRALTARPRRGVDRRPGSPARRPVLGWAAERRRESMIHPSRGAISVFAACAACSNRGSGTRAELADYCDRVCNCANDATGECMRECADERADSDISRDCVDCVQTSGCSQIQRECAEPCANNTDPFPHAAPLPAPDGATCPGGLDFDAFVTSTTAIICKARLSRCGYSGDLATCIMEHQAYPYREDPSGRDEECDATLALDCLTALAATPCEYFADEDWYLDVLVSARACEDAMNSCCDADPAPNERRKDGGLEAEAEAESGGDT